jgi:hypothetical protein
VCRSACLVERVVVRRYQVVPASADSGLDAENANAWTTFASAGNDALVEERNVVRLVSAQASTYLVPRHHRNMERRLSDYKNGGVVLV